MNATTHRNDADHLWSREDIRASVPEFARIYADRPITDNTGGMRIPHLFATWYIVKWLQPTVIVESGVWKGLGTWFMEQAAPAAIFFCIDTHPENMLYQSKRATYLTTDFSEHDWNGLPRASTLLFFDDHQDALKRIRYARKHGFRHLIFEDNYPTDTGDCYSLKKALMQEAAFPSKPSFFMEKLFGQTQMSDGKYLEKILKLYAEFPPVLLPERTRFDTDWTQERYPTPAPVFAENEEIEAYPDVPFKEEAMDYTWICYAEMRKKVPLLFP